MSTKSPLGSSSYIYGVLPVATDTSDSSDIFAPYHNGTGEYNRTQCNPGDWGFAIYGNYSGNTTICTPPYAVPSTGSTYTDTSPTPYNFMAGIATGQGTPSVMIPSINGHFPDEIPPGTNTGMNGQFAAFTDQSTTAIPFEGNPSNQYGTGYIIVAYNVNWFVTNGGNQLSNTTADMAAINGFLSNGNWINVSSDTSYPPYDTTNSNWPTYNGLYVPSIQYQIYNYVLGDNTGKGNNFCGQISNVPCTNSAQTCSNYYANVPGNLCTTMKSSLFNLGSNPTTSTSPGLQALATSYTNSTVEYCKNAQFSQPDSGGNTGPAECFCVDPAYSSLYNDLTGIPATDKIIPTGNEGCWWQPCRDPSTYLPTFDHFIYPDQTTCNETICAQVIQATGNGTVTASDQAQFSQYMYCSGPSTWPGGGGSPAVPATAFPWWLIIGMIVVIAILITVIVYIIRKRGQEADETEKESSDT